MTLRILYAPHAVAQLEALYSYVAENSGPKRADAFVGAIVDYCDGFETFRAAVSGATTYGRVCTSSASGGV